MNLYGHWRSSAAYRVRIGLNLKGAILLEANLTGANLRGITGLKH